MPKLKLGVPLIDMRTLEQVRQRHILKSTHIPSSAYNDRSMEFPPKTTIKFQLLMNLSNSEDLKEKLLSYYVDDIVDVHDDDDSEFWESVPLNLVGSGEFPLECQSQLWNPSKLIPIFIPLLSDWLARRNRDPCVIIDAGSGTGRNAVYLAQHMKSFQLKIFAIDNRRAMIEKLDKFASLYALSDSIVGIKGDVENELIIHSQRVAPDNNVDVVLFFRFTHKPAIRRAVSLLKKRGGLLVIESFHHDCLHPASEELKLRENEAYSIVRDVLTTEESNSSALNSQGSTNLTKSDIDEVVEPKFKKVRVDSSENPLLLQLLEMRELTEDCRPLIYSVIEILPSK